MGVYSFSMAGLVVLLGYIALHHLVLFLRFPQKGEYAWFAAIAATWCFHGTMTYMRIGLFDEQKILLFYRLGATSKILVLILIICFFSFYLRIGWGRAQACLLGLCALCLGLHLLSPLAIGLSDYQGLYRLNVPRQELFLDVKVSRGWPYFLLVFTAMVSFLWLLVMGFRALANFELRNRGKAVIVAICVVIAFVGFGILGDLKLVPVVPIVNHSMLGLIIALNLNMQDEISLLAKLRKALAASEDRVSQIANAVPGVVFQVLIPFQGIPLLLYVNQQAKDLLGLTIQSKITSPEVFLTHLMPEYQERFRKEVLNALKQRNPFWVFEGAYRHPDERVVWIRLESALTETPEGLVYTGVIMDHGASRKLWEERESAARELRLRNEEQESILHAVSYELRLPLLQVGGQLLAMDAAMQSGRFPDRDAFEGIRKGCDLMEVRLQSLSHILRAGQIPLEMENVNLDAALDRAIQIVAYQRRLCNADIVHSPLPYGFADSLQVELVFTSLLESAMNRRRDDVVCRIEIGAEIRGENVVIWVQDNGKGYPEEEVEHIFDLFSMAGTEVGVDTGAGLVLVRRALIRMGGSVHAESIQNQKTIIWVNFRKEKVQT